MVPLSLVFKLHKSITVETYQQLNRCRKNPSRLFFQVLETDRSLKTF